MNDLAWFLIVLLSGILMGALLGKYVLAFL